MNTQLVFECVETLGWTLVHFLWQGTAVAIALWICLTAIGKSSPRLRHALAALALVSMCVFAIVTFRTHIAQTKSFTAQVATTPDSTPASLVSQQNGPALAAETVSANNPPHPADPPRPTNDYSSLLRPALPWLVGIWAVGVLFLGFRLSRSWIQVRRWKREGTIPDDTILLRRFQILSSSLRIRRPVKLLISAKATVPMVIGWLKPVVLVPAGILAGLPAAQIEALLAHELTHVRRYDYLANLLQTAVETLFFYHPAVWWVGAQIRNAREHCCDDAAAALSGGPLHYAKALTALEEFRGAVPAPGVAANGGSLLGRIRRLANSQNPPRPFWPVLALVAVATAGLVLVASTRATPPDPDIPTAISPNEDPSDFTLQLDEKGNLLFNVDNLAKIGPGSSVTIRAHKGTPHGAVVKLLDAVKRAGVTDVRFAVVAEDEDRLVEDAAAGKATWILSLDAHQSFLDITGKKVANLHIYPDGKAFVSTRRQFFHEYVESKLDPADVETLLRWLAKDPKTTTVDPGVSKVDAMRTWRLESADLKGSDEGAAAVAFQLDGKTYLRKIKATGDPVFDRLFDDVLPKVLAGEKKGGLEDLGKGAAADDGKTETRPDVATPDPDSKSAPKELVP